MVSIVEKFCTATLQITYNFRVNFHQGHCQNKSDLNCSFLLSIEKISMSKILCRIFSLQYLRLHDETGQLEYIRIIKRSKASNALVEAMTLPKVTRGWIPVGAHSWEFELTASLKIPSHTIPWEAILLLLRKEKNYRVRVLLYSQVH